MNIKRDFLTNYAIYSIDVYRRPVGSPIWAFQRIVIGPLKFKMASSWRTSVYLENREIVISQPKVVRFWWNLVHNSSLLLIWTRWLSQLQLWKFL